MPGPPVCRGHVPVPRSGALHSTDADAFVAAGRHYAADLTMGQTKAPLKLMQSIPLPALKAGDFDHFAPDVEGHRLFLTAEENGKLLVFDTNSNKLIHTIEELKAPHAVLYLKELNKIFQSSRSNNLQCRF